MPHILAPSALEFRAALATVIPLTLIQAPVPSDPEVSTAPSSVMAEGGSIEPIPIDWNHSDQRTIDIVIQNVGDEELTLGEIRYVVDDLDQRVTLLLDATSDENIRTVSHALQRVVDFSDRIDRLEAQADSLENRMWAAMILFVGGVFTLFFKDEIKAQFASKS